MSRFLREKLNKLAPYTPGEQPKTDGLIKLNTNENPYPPSPLVKQAVEMMDKDRFRLYSDPAAAEPTQAIADYYGLTSEQVLLGNGSDEILAFCYMAFGEKIYFPAISYGFYPVFADVFNCTAVEVPMNEDLTLNQEAFKQNDGTVIIANPNAPTGVALSTYEIKEIVEANPDQVVIVDEAYVDFGAESSVNMIDDFENLLVVQTFSKSRSLAGMRAGFALANAELIDDLNRIKFSFNPYNVNMETAVAAAAAIRDDDYFQMQRKKIMDTREAFVARVKEMGFEVMPSSANFVFVKTGEEYFDALREKNILVRHWDKEPIRDWLRITIGRDQDMERLVEAMEEIKIDSERRQAMETRED